MNEKLKLFEVESGIKEIFKKSPEISMPSSKEELYEMCFGDDGKDVFTVEYDINGKNVVEAEVIRCKNGVSVNFPEDYMRRRDPNSMLIGDDFPTDKIRYKDMYGRPFDELRQRTFDWLAGQKLIVIPFMSGGKEYGYPSLLIAPKNAAFFAMSVADLQSFVPVSEINETFKPRAIIFLAPPFRHTHFGGKQIVVHNRKPDVHECFAYNLYMGPSAKKGVYAVLLDIGESEGWITAHASAVKAVSPYKNQIVIMHEGASGGGKSEMLEHIRRDANGKVCVATNTVSGDALYFDIKDTCSLFPIIDDMALCHPKMQDGSKKLVIKDAEDGWFLRFDNIHGYGDDPYFEKICTQPSEPIVFLNIDGVPRATCLIWEHTLDSNGKPCSNPRAIVPRHLMPNIINDPVEVSVRSFGVRMPPCTRENPTYGIAGLFHVLPPALAWLWRLVAPRGYNNPSIVSEGGGLSSEGVGSYWPFATGKKVKQANLLLQQIMDYPNTKCILIPNQHVGAYKVAFMSEWLTREFITRRNGAEFEKEYLIASRCPILGYTVDEVKVDGNNIPNSLLRPEYQPEIGLEAYDKGAKILTDFFKKEVLQFMSAELNPIGRQIINLCLRDAPVEEYEKILPMKSVK